VAGAVTVGGGVKVGGGVVGGGIVMLGGVVSVGTGSGDMGGVIGRAAGAAGRLGPW